MKNGSILQLNLRNVGEEFDSPLSPLSLVEISPLTPTLTPTLTNGYELLRTI
jgi:hypothetical protein